MQNNEQAKAMAELSQFYGGKTINPESMRLWQKKLQFVDSRDLWVAVEEITNHEKTFPVPATVIKYSNIAKTNRLNKESIVRELEAQKMHKKREEDAQEFFKPTNYRSQIAKDCVAVTLKLIDWPRDKQAEKLNWLYGEYKILDKKYPTAGFNQSAEECKRELEKLLDDEHIDDEDEDLLAKLGVEAELRQQSSNSQAWFEKECFEEVVDV